MKSRKSAKPGHRIGRFVTHVSFDLATCFLAAGCHPTKSHVLTESTMNSIAVAANPLQDTTTLFVDGTTGGLRMLRLTYGDRAAGAFDTVALTDVFRTFQVQLRKADEEIFQDEVKKNVAAIAALTEFKAGLAKFKISQMTENNFNTGVSTPSHVLKNVLPSNDPLLGDDIANQTLKNQINELNDWLFLADKGDKKYGLKAAEIAVKYLTTVIEYVRDRNIYLQNRAHPPTHYIPFNAYGMWQHARDRTANGKALFDLGKKFTDRLSTLPLKELEAADVAALVRLSVDSINQLYLLGTENWATTNLAMRSKLDLLRRTTSLAFDLNFIDKTSVETLKHTQIFNGFYRGIFNDMNSIVIGSNGEKPIFFEAKERLDNRAAVDVNLVDVLVKSVLNPDNTVAIDAATGRPKQLISYDQYSLVLKTGRMPSNAIFALGYGFGEADQFLYNRATASGADTDVTVRQAALFGGRSWVQNVLDGKPSDQTKLEALKRMKAAVEAFGGDTAGGPLAKYLDRHIDWMTTPNDPESRLSASLKAEGFDPNSIDKEGFVQDPAALAAAEAAVVSASLDPPSNTDGVNDGSGRDNRDAADSPDARSGGGSTDVDGKRAAEARVVGK